MFDFIFIITTISYVFHITNTLMIREVIPIRNNLSVICSFYLFNNKAILYISIFKSTEQMNKIHLLSQFYSSILFYIDKAWNQCRLN